MTGMRIAIAAALGVSLFGVAACSRNNTTPVETRPAQEILDENQFGDRGPPRSTIWDIFAAREDPGRVGAVNKYIWNASLDVLDFLPVQSVDPFSGVIVTGFGAPPGSGGRSYKATILISDPALDARSLNVALQTRSGAAADGATTRAIEDAILTRARQLYQQDSRL